MGKVYLVGAGPGDPGLFTVKGTKLLKKADMVVYDDLIPQELLNLVPDHCVKHYAGKRSGQHSASQEEINRLLIQGAKQYGTVIRLKGGDPFVFGRGGEEAMALQRKGIPFEVVPGVTSAVAVPSHLGIPLTHRQEARSFHVITGHLAQGEPDYRVYAQCGGTLVFLMGLSSMEKIVTGLLIGGMDPKTPAAVISNAYSRKERSVRAPLDRIASEAAELNSPAVIVIGACAAYEFRDNRISRKDAPRISVVGSSAFFGRMKQSMDPLKNHLSHLAEIALEIIPERTALLEESLRKIETYSWIVLNSQNAVRMLFDTVDRVLPDKKPLASVRFAAVGPGTAEALDHYGYPADYMPEDYTTEALAIGLSQIANHDRLLIIRAAEGSPVMETVFERKGTPFDKIELYRSSASWKENDQSLQETDILVFASASGVRSFHTLLNQNGKRLPEKILLACIGPVTAEAVHQWGKTPALISERHSAEGLAETLRRCIREWKE